jgi:hypothetical protein
VKVRERVKDMALRVNSGNGFQPSNLFRSDKGMRMTRVRENRVVVNVIRDNVTVTKHLGNLRANKSKVFYRDSKGEPIQAEGTAAAEMAKIYEYEILYINRDTVERKTAQSILGQSMTNGMQATLVPCHSVINGALGDSIAGLQRKYRPFAVAELPGRDTNTDGGVGIVGGIAPFHNSLQKPMNVGDLMVAEPVPPSQIRELAVQEGNIANARGRLTFVYRKFNNENLYSHVDVRNVIGREWVIDDVKGTGDPQFVLLQHGGDYDPKKPFSWSGDYKNHKAAQTLTEQNFADAVLHQIKAMGNILDVGSLINLWFLANGGAVPRFTWKEQYMTGVATLMVVAAGFYRKGPVDTKAVKDFCKNLKTTGKTAADVTRLQEGFEHNILDLLNSPESARLFGSNSLQEFVRAMSQHKVAAEEAIMGICVQGAQSGSNGEMHLRAFQH